MTDRMEDKAATFEALSALADGESTERDVARACQAWRESEGARSRWQTYQLIGDAMRSDGVAATRTSDVDFLAAVRERLVQEPVVLAPALKAAKGRDRSELLPGALDGQVARQRRWSGPVSVAAGFVLVLGAVVNVFQGGVLSPNQAAGTAALAQNAAGVSANALTPSSWTDPEMALAPGVSNILRTGLAADGSAGQRAVSARPTFTQSGRVEADGHSGYLIFVRDDQLDQLLAARREQAEARSLVSPASGMIRQASFEASQP
jgi:sigma-E factor negative regulatory protein RseA